MQTVRIADCLIAAAIVAGCSDESTDDVGGANSSTDNAHADFADLIKVACETKVACAGKAVGSVEECVADQSMMGLDQRAITSFAAEALARCGKLGEVCLVYTCLACTFHANPTGVVSDQIKSCVRSTPATTNGYCWYAGQCPGQGKKYP